MSGKKITMMTAALITGAVVFFLSLPAYSGGQDSLVNQKIKELTDLNEQLHKKLGSLEKYNNKNIYVKVRFLPSPGDKKRFKIEKISLDEIPGTADKDTAVVKYKVVEKDVKDEEDEKDKYKLDLSYVLPASENEKDKTE